MAELIKQTDANGLITTFEIIGKDAFNVTRSQDVAPVLDFNKACQSDTSFNNGYTQSGDLQHVARVPLILMELWWKEAGRPAGGVYGKAMNEVMKKKLNDPDYAYLRTGRGEIR